MPAFGATSAGAPGMAGAASGLTATRPQPGSTVGAAIVRGIAAQPLPEAPSIERVHESDLLATAGTGHHTEISHVSPPTPRPGWARRRGVRSGRRFTLRPAGLWVAPSHPVHLTIRADGCPARAANSRQTAAATGACEGGIRLAVSVNGFPDRVGFFLQAAHLPLSLGGLAGRTSGLTLAFSHERSIDDR
jgi:hypothetical protein